MQCKSTIVAIFWISLLTGCASDGKDDILPQDGPTMKQVYDHHFSGEPILASNADAAKENSASDSSNRDGRSTGQQTAQIQRRTSPADYELAGFTREVNTEINQIFPRLRNPTLIMYVYPHLAGQERHPVPGYATSFRLFANDEYALPGEPEQRY